MITRPNSAPFLMAPGSTTVCCSPGNQHCTKLSTRSADLPSLAARYKPQVVSRQVQHHGQLIVALRLLAQRLPRWLRVSLHSCRRKLSKHFIAQLSLCFLQDTRLLSSTFFFYLTRHIIPFRIYLTRAELRLPSSIQCLCCAKPGDAVYKC